MHQFSTSNKTDMATKASESDPLVTRDKSLVKLIECVKAKQTHAVSFKLQSPPPHSSCTPLPSLFLPSLTSPFPLPASLSFPQLFLPLSLLPPFSLLPPPFSSLPLFPPFLSLSPRKMLQHRGEGEPERAAHRVTKCHHSIKLQISMPFFRYSYLFE